MKLTLDLKPLSLNNCYAGRRHDTAAKKQYDSTLQMLLPHRSLPGPYYTVTFRFFLKRCFAGDLDNLCKVLLDNLVDAGIISGDRNVVEIHLYKFPAKVKRDRIDVDIESIPLPTES